MRIPSNEEIHAVYEQGEAAVVALVIGIIEAQNKQIEALEARLEALEAQQKKNRKIVGTVASHHQAMGIRNRSRKVSVGEVERRAAVKKGMRARP